MVTGDPKKDLNLRQPVEVPTVVSVVQERAPAPEVSEAAETKGTEQADASISESQPVDVVPAVVSRVSVPVQPKVNVDRLAKEIESILSEDLTDLYLAMPPDKQQEFKTKGEETASKVRELVRAAKVNAKKIFQLIRDWMKIIPGVNRFFLEQEAKIKTDKILLVSEEERKQKNEV